MKCKSKMSCIGGSLSKLIIRYVLWVCGMPTFLCVPQNAKEGGFHVFHELLLVRHAFVRTLLVYVDLYGFCRDRKMSWLAAGSWQLAAAAAAPGRRDHPELHEVVLGTDICS